MVVTSGSPPLPLPGVTPRWEWRTFGDRFDTADSALSPLAPERVHSSDERYFLSIHSDASAKVRDELMDVKALLDVDDRGLELWAPTLKAGFPLAGDEVARLLDALGVTPPSRLQPAYTMEALVAELIEPHPDLTVVVVHKERVHYSLEGCMVETTEITADGTSTRTVSVESTDRSQVAATVDRLGFSGTGNVSVARGLKALVGFGGRRLGVIDVGTNSVKFHLGERRADGSLHALADRAVVTRLGEGQSDAGVLGDAPIARTVDTIVAMVDEARRERAEVVAVGTAGLRRAPNRATLVDAVLERTGVAVDVISGEEEARLAYLAATSALPAARGRLVVFDSGGGSTQFTFGRDDGVDEQFSLDIGAVRVAERFGLDAATSMETLDATLAWLASELHRLGGRERPDALVAIGGTATNLAAVSHALHDYDPDVVHGTVLDIAELDRQIGLYRSLGAEQRRDVVGLQPARAEVILGGACIVRTILTTLGLEEMTVSDRGLRHGVLISRLPR